MKYLFPPQRWVLLEDEYLVGIVRERGGGEGQTVVTHCNTEPLVAHVEGPQTHPPGFENTQHTTTLLLLSLLDGSILPGLIGVVDAEQMVRDRSLVLPPNLIDDRLRLLDPPVDDQPPGRLGNNPVQQDQP